MKLNISDLSLASQIIVCSIIAIILITQSTLIFLSARKRGRNAWFWGFIGLLNVPSSALLYYLFVIYPDKKKEEE
jgi:hypothetical protein